ncbi:helix-turn-helix domain-containing protein [Exiguobacterium aurantiacum]
MDVRERLERYIKENGIQRMFVAKQLGVSKSYLSNWLNGNKDGSARLIAKAEAYLEGKEDGGTRLAQ